MTLTLSRWFLGKVLGILIKGWALPIHIFLKYHFFMNIILILFCLLSLSFIDKGLAMSQLGGGGGGGGG